MTTTTSKPKRLKQVFRNAEEVAHIWAKQSQQTGRSANCYFEGDTIYSYGSHFPVARYVHNKPGKRIVLFTTRDYSVTTAKHKGEILHAIPPDVVTIYCSDVLADNKHRHLANIKELSDSIRELAELHRTSRQRDYVKSIVEKVQNLYAYCKLVRVGLTKQLIKWATVDLPSDIMADLLGMSKSALLELEAKKSAARARQAEINEANEAKRIARYKAQNAEYEKQRLEREEKQREKERLFNLPDTLQACIDGFHTDQSEMVICGENGGKVSVYDVLRHHDYTALRIVTPQEPKTIETSRYASISVETAKRIWPILKARGNPGDVEGFRAVGFHGDTFVIGCHRIPFAEIEYIARELGLEPTEQYRNCECLSCHHTWKEPVTLSISSPGLSGEKSPQCPKCDSRGVMSSPVQES